MLSAEGVATSVAGGDSGYLEEIISGRYLDYMLSEVLAHLPDVAERLKGLGPAGLVMQARPSNTINALTIPTKDGVIIVYNLGLYGMLLSFSRAVASTLELHDAEQATMWLAGVVDWATSRAKEPRFERQLQLNDESQGLAVNLASRAQRFVLCHELGHAVAFDRGEAPTRSADISGTAVMAQPESWTKEYDADQQGLAMYLRVLTAQGKSEAAALVGAEVFLNAAGMLQQSSSDEETVHPPPENRLAKVRTQFQIILGERSRELAGPSLAVRHVLEALRNFVGDEVRRRRLDTTRRLDETFRAFATRGTASPDQMRAAAMGVSRRLLDSPGATLDYLHWQIFKPKLADEADGGSQERILAVNAALHFEKPLQEAIEIPLLRLHTSTR